MADNKIKKKQTKRQMIALLMFWESYSLEKKKNVCIEKIVKIVKWK